jgi:hypothetical protein
VSPILRDHTRAGLSVCLVNQGLLVTTINPTTKPTNYPSAQQEPPEAITVPTSSMTDRENSPDSGSGEPSPASDHQEDQQSSGDVSVKAEQGDDNSSGSNQAVQMPVQKRRRVTRACDECRRKKIKCDGKQPCTHCSVYSYG